MNLFLFGFTRTNKGANTAPLAPKLSYFDGPGLTTERLPRAGVIGRMYYVDQLEPQITNISIFPDKDPMVN